MAGPRLPRYRLMTLIGLLLAALSVFLLRRQTETYQAPAFTSLAVLPFELATDDSALSHLTAGLSLDLLVRLQFLESLQCIPRAQVLAWQGAAVTRRQLAKELGAEVIINGVLRSTPGRLQLTLQIEDARDGSEIAILQLKDSTERVFELQRRAALQVVEVLQLPLDARERDLLSRDPTRSLKAYDYAAQAMQYLEDLANPRGPGFAADLFRRAIQLDPRFAQAHIGLSEAMWLTAVRTGDPDALDQAEREARSALDSKPEMMSAAIALTKTVQTRQRPTLATPLTPLAVTRLSKPDEAQRNLAIGFLLVGRMELAEAAWKSATASGKEHWLNWYALAQFLRRSGRYREAEMAFAEAARWSPTAMIWPLENLVALKLATGDLSGAVEVFETLAQESRDAELLQQVATAYSVLGRLDHAAALYRQVLQLNPGAPHLYRELGDVLNRQGHTDAALDEYAMGLRLTAAELETQPTNTDLQRQKAILAAKAQSCPQALPLAATLRRRLPKSAAVCHELAMIFALCGDRAMALDSLRAAMTYGLTAEVARSEPAFGIFAADAEFEEILSATEIIPPSP